MKVDKQTDKHSKKVDKQTDKHSKESRQTN